jgi:hypothetical protein
MPIVKKAPAIMTREIRIEQPVNELLDDYARFIESSVDYVVNSVLKKLSKDPDYREWRDEQRNGQPGQDETHPVTRGAKA